MMRVGMLLNALSSHPCQYHTDCEEQEGYLKEYTGVAQQRVDDLKLSYDRFDQMGTTNRTVSRLYTKFKRTLSVCFERNREAELHKQIYDLSLVDCHHHTNEELEECKKRIDRYKTDIMDLLSIIGNCEDEINQAMDYRSTASSYRLSTVYVDLTRQIIDDGDKVLVKVAEEISDLIAKYKLYTHRRKFDRFADKMQSRIRQYKDTNEKGRLVARLTKLKNLKKMTEQDFKQFRSKFSEFFKFVHFTIRASEDIRLKTVTSMPSNQEQYFVKPFQDLDISSWRMRTQLFLGNQFYDVKVPSEEGRVKRVRR